MRSRRRRASAAAALVAAVSVSISPATAATAATATATPVMWPFTSTLSATTVAEVRATRKTTADYIKSQLTAPIYDMAEVKALFKMGR